MMLETLLQMPQKKLPKIRHRAAAAFTLKSELKDMTMQFSFHFLDRRQSIAD